LIFPFCVILHLSEWHSAFLNAFILGVKSIFRTKYPKRHAGTRFENIIHLSSFLRGIIYSVDSSRIMFAVISFSNRMKWARDLSPFVTLWLFESEFSRYFTTRTKWWTSYLCVLWESSSSIFIPEMCWFIHQNSPMDSTDETL